jgi:hypothetical protein
MTGFAVAVERKQWSLVSLYLLAGISEFSAKLPPDSLDALLDVLGGLEPLPEERRHGR